MDLLKDIKDILKNDKEHHLKIEVDCYSVKVYLEYDPEMNFIRNIMSGERYFIGKVRTLATLVVR